MRISLAAISGDALSSRHAFAWLQPGDNHSLHVATTFGLLVSHDDGCSFRWICEQNIGYGGTFDPKYRIAGDGTLFATTFSGLRVIRDDGGCGANWQPDNKAIAKSTDGTAWTKVFRFVELAGPVECPTGTPRHDTCGAQWPSLQQQFGSTGPTACNAPPPPKTTGGCAMRATHPPASSVRSASSPRCAPGRYGAAAVASSASSASRQLG